MKFNAIKKELSNAFRRLTGIKKSTFDSMVKLLRLTEKTRKSQGEKPNKLSIVMQEV